MFLMRRQLKSLFSDKSSIVLRTLLQAPDHAWKIPELSQRGVSFGLASLVLNLAESLGYVERVRIGPGSFTRLTQVKNLLRDWHLSYSFDRNPHVYLHCVEGDFLEKLKTYCRNRNLRYALTLFSASRFISPYVKDDRHFVYLDMDLKQAKTVLEELQNEMGLLKLARGGNACFAIPYYHKSVFTELQTLEGHPAVSNLQLYLDLMGFKPHGPEEAEHLIQVWNQRGIPFARP
jgi:hypothetical protein